MRQVKAVELRPAGVMRSDASGFVLFSFRFVVSFCFRSRSRFRFVFQPNVDVCRPSFVSSTCLIVAYLSLWPKCGQTSCLAQNRSRVYN